MSRWQDDYPNMTYTDIQRLHEELKPRAKSSLKKTDFVGQIQKAIEHINNAQNITKQDTIKSSSDYQGSISDRLTALRKQLYSIMNEGAIHNTLLNRALIRIKEEVVKLLDNRAEYRRQTGKELQHISRSLDETITFWNEINK